MLKRVSVLFEKSLRNHLETRRYQSPAVQEAMGFLHTVLSLTCAKPPVRPIPDRPDAMHKLLNVGWYENEQLRRSLHEADRLAVTLSRSVGPSIEISLYFFKKGEKQCRHEIQVSYLESDGSYLGLQEGFNTFVK